MVKSVNVIAKEMWDFCDLEFSQSGCTHDIVFDCNRTFWYPNSTDISIRKTNCQHLENYCKPITFSYFCQFYKKYASEVYYTLKKYFNTTPFVFPSYDILSIGCGPCTELLGFLKFYSLYNDNQTVNYYGSDLNPNWKDIHNKWQSILASEANINFSITDDVNSLKPNILLLNYVLSHVSQYEDQNGQSQFIDLITSITCNMDKDSIVLITEENNKNPASGEKTVNFIDKLSRALLAQDLIKEPIKYQFSLGNSQRERYSNYGAEHTSKQGIFENYSHPETYRTLDWCTGLQNILVVK